MTAQNSVAEGYPTLVDEDLREHARPTSGFSASPAFSSSSSTTPKTPTTATDGASAALTTSSSSTTTPPVTEGYPTLEDPREHERPIGGAPVALSDTPLSPSPIPTTTATPAIPTAGTAAEGKTTTNASEVTTQIGGALYKKLLKDTIFSEKEGFFSIACTSCPEGVPFTIKAGPVPANYGAESYPCGHCGRDLVLIDTTTVVKAGAAFVQVRGFS